MSFTYYDEYADFEPALIPVDLEFFATVQRELTLDFQVSSFCDLYKSDPNDQNLPCVYPALRLIGEDVDFEKIKLNVEGANLVATDSYMEDDCRVMVWVFAPTSTGYAQIQYGAALEDKAKLTWFSTDDNSYLVCDFDENPVSVTDAKLGLYQEIYTPEKKELREDNRRILELLKNTDNGLEVSSYLELIQQNLEKMKECNGYTC
jgi:hypothetical protein